MSSSMPARTTLDDATRLVSQDSTMAMAGETNLLDLMSCRSKLGQVADVNRINFGESRIRR